MPGTRACIREDKNEMYEEAKNIDYNMKREGKREVKILERKKSFR